MDIKKGDMVKISRHWTGKVMGIETYARGASWLEIDGVGDGRVTHRFDLSGDYAADTTVVVTKRARRWYPGDVFMEEGDSIRVRDGYGRLRDMTGVIVGVLANDADLPAGYEHVYRVPGREED